MYRFDDSLQDVEDEMVIWKYMNFTSFYRMLFTNALFFRRLDSFTDDLEGTLPEEPAEERNEARDEYKGFTLANAWSLNEDESYAMWKIYLRGDSDGIAIKSTVGILKHCFNENQDFDVYCGKVNYNHFTCETSHPLAFAFIKHQTYSYENEYRAVLANQFEVSKNGDVECRTPKYEVGTDVTVNLETLMQEVLISPFSESWFDDVVKSALQHLHPEFDLARIRKSVIRDR
jgi:hypothetical protein